MTKTKSGKHYCCGKYIRSIADRRRHQELFHRPSAEFIGYQEIMNEAPIPLFNIEGNHPREGSTVFAGTLVNLGIPVPHIPSFEQWQEIKA